MKIVDIINRISVSNFVSEHLPLEMQMGIPYPELINGKLCLVFLPHKEEHSNDQTIICPSSFKIVYVYPFNRIVEFQNMTFFHNENVSEPVSVTDKKMLRDIVYCLEDLYKEYDRILARVEETGTVTEVMVEKCQKKFREVTEQIGLADIYRF